MKIQPLLLMAAAGAALISAGCTGGYSLGVPLGLTEAEIAALPAAQQAAVRTAYAQRQANSAQGRGAQQFNAGKEIVDASRSATLPAIAKPEPPDGDNRYRDTSPGAVK